MNRNNRIAGGLAAAALTMGVVAASAAHAGTQLNTVADTATIGGSGHRVEVTIVLGCDAGERARFGVSLAQGDTEATGQGAGRCTGDVQHFPVTVTTHGGETLTEGAATAHAWVETRHGQHTHPRHTWTEQITLE